MSEELETAICAAMEKVAAPGIYSIHDASMFRIGFLAGYSHRQDIEIAQLNEKLERLNGR